MNPTIGRIVIARVDPLQNNGATEAPAIITRVWGPGMVNLRVFVDTAAMPLSQTSAKLFESQEDAEKDGATLACWWPARA